MRSGLCAGQFSLKVQRPAAVLDITTAPSRAVFLFELDDGHLMEMARASPFRLKILSC